MSPSPLSTKIGNLALNICVAAVAFLAPVHNLLTLSLGLVFVDFVLGILAARKRGEAITSTGMRATIGKIIAYELGIIFAFVIEQNFGFGLPLVKLTASVIGLRETKSVFENLNTLTGVDFLAILQAKLPSKDDNNK